MSLNTIVFSFIQLSCSNLCSHDQKMSPLLPLQSFCTLHIESISLDIQYCVTVSVSPPPSLKQKIQERGSEKILFEAAFVF